MFSFSALFVTGLFCFLGGIALGAIGLSYARTRIFSGNIEQRLHQTQTDLQNYQREVAAHFAQTSALVNNLIQSYREVHEHLADGALKLATPEISKQILETINTESKLRLREQPLEPPRDWAPRHPGTAGTLSDDYGLKEEQNLPDHFRPTESPDDFDFDGKSSRY